MYSISFIKWVSKFIKGKYFKEEHPENIELIFVTLFVLKLDIFKEVNELQLVNIFSIFETLDVIN